MNRKLWRDLLASKGQVLTIGLVVAAGIAAFVTLKGTHHSLIVAKETFYEKMRFADVFAQAERVPLSVAERLRTLPGVAKLDARVVSPVTLPMQDMAEPAVGFVVSLPSDGVAPLNALHLTEGRMFAPGRENETVVLQSFAEAHGLKLGDVLPAILDGVQREFTVVGVGVSPEYLFAMPVGGLFADEKRFAVLFMSEETVRPAYGMEGAFNDVAITLQPGVNPQSVMAPVNTWLAPYGGVDAVERADQYSENVLRSEIAQVGSMADSAPVIFLLVAAFLLNVVLSRMISLQRTQIATMRALGYSSTQIGLHFLGFGLLIVSLGSVAGALAGLWMGDGMIAMYTEYFRIPELRYRVSGELFLVSIGFSLTAGALGAILAVRNVLALEPAEAMRPAAPAQYTRSWIEWLGMHRWFGSSGRMVVREMQRYPWRLFASTMGIAMALAISLIGYFSADSFDALTYTAFHEASREDISVSFRRPVSVRGVEELLAMPGVLAVEPMHAVTVRMRAGRHTRKTVIQGYADGMVMRRLLNDDLSAQPIPSTGILLTDELAKALHVHVGDIIEADVRVREQPTLTIHVAGLTQEPLGLQGHMNLRELWRITDEPYVMSSALLRVDPASEDAIYDVLKTKPEVSATLNMSTVIRQFHKQSAESMQTMTVMLTFFAMIIAVGVVYNNARVSLSTRQRDLASLRVLGFSQSEVSFVLLGEILVQTLLAVPLGLWLGTLMCQGMVSGMDPEQYRLPLVLTHQSYAYASLVTLTASAISAWLVQRKVRTLDLQAVLKEA